MCQVGLAPISDCLRPQHLRTSCMEHCPGAPPHWLPSQPVLYPKSAPLSAKLFAVSCLFPGLFGLLKHTQHSSAASCSLAEGDVVPFSKGDKSTICNLALFPRLQNEGSSSILPQYSEKKKSVRVLKQHFKS